MPDDPSLLSDLMPVLLGSADASGPRVLLPWGSWARIDPYVFQSRPQLLARVVEALLPLLPSRTEVVCGTELDGVPLAAALSQRTGLPLAVARRTPVSAGEAARVEGPPVEDRHVVLVDAVADSGATLTGAARAVQRRGGRVEVAVCVLDVRNGALARLSRLDVDLRALTTLSELPPPVRRPRGRLRRLIAG